LSFPPLELTLLLALIFAGGFVDAIAGGGGLITLPAYFACGLPPHAAIATNKFSSCLGTAVAVARFSSARAMRMEIGLPAGLGALLGAVAGSQMVLWVPEAVIHILLLCLVPLALSLVLCERRLRVARPAAAGRRPLPWSFGIGLAIGLYDGFFGPGTGTFLTIAFSALLGLDLLCAAANARLANLASNLGALAVFLIEGRVVFPLAWFAAAAGVAGNFLGARLAVRRGARVIRPFMVAVLLLLFLELLRRRLGLAP
jgi:uncharacterized membrane protein YfcA